MIKMIKQNINLENILHLCVIHKRKIPEKCQYDIIVENCEKFKQLGYRGEDAVIECTMPLYLDKDKHKAYVKSAITSDFKGDYNKEGVKSY